MQNDVDIDAKAVDGETPLHDAAVKDNCEIIALLLTYGADIEAENNDGQTPLFKAVLSHSEAAVAQLIDYGANVVVSSKAH